MTDDALARVKAFMKLKRRNDYAAPFTSDVGDDIEALVREVEAGRVLANAVFKHRSAWCFVPANVCKAAVDYDAARKGTE